MLSRKRVLFRSCVWGVQFHWFTWKLIVAACGMQMQCVSSVPSWSLSFMHRQNTHWTCTYSMSHTHIVTTHTVYTAHGIDTDQESTGWNSHCERRKQMEDSDAVCNVYVLQLDLCSMEVIQKPGQCKGTLLPVQEQTYSLMEIQNIMEKWTQQILYEPKTKDLNYVYLWTKSPISKTKCLKDL